MTQPVGSAWKKRLETSSPHENIETIISQHVASVCGEARTVNGEKRATLDKGSLTSHWPVCTTIEPRCFCLVCRMLSCRSRSTSPICTDTSRRKCCWSPSYLSWIVLRGLLLSRMQACVVTRIVPRHHDVLEILILHYRPSACFLPSVPDLRNQG
jgi:hypothetical protein